MSASAMSSQSGSVFSDLESSEDILPSSAERSSNKGRPKKRKANQTSQTIRGFSQPRIKRLKPFYNDGYRELFNQTVKEIASEGTSDNDSLPSTQVGATSWSSREKETLFSALGKKGRHDLRGIAIDIKSKSESEVHIYLQLLEKSSADSHTYGPSSNVVSIIEIKAAAEISQDCSVALDLAAEALSALQQKQEEKWEKKQHPENWLLTPNIAEWADHQFNVGEEGENVLSRALPAATLLNLKTFLSLSTRFFMNSSTPENNWRTYAERGQCPSIMHTAFSDFHTLAVSITKRLIQSSLFFAMSRLRAMDDPGHYTNRRHVKRRDVVAALNVLSMEASARKTWTRTARKCKLRVYEEVKGRKALGRRYGYDEIESILASSSVGTRGRYRRTPEAADNAFKLQGQESAASSTEDATGDDMSSVPSSGDEDRSILDDADLMKSSADGNDKKASDSQLFDQLQDDYADFLDQRASQREEYSLWESLGKNPAEIMGSQDVQLPKVPDARTRAREDHVDWTSWVDYVGLWEKLETPVPASDFAANRGLERTRDLVAELRSPHTSSVDSGGVVTSGRFQLSEEFVHDGSSSWDQSLVGDLGAASDDSEEQ
ncbi:hypothetical protein N7G274_010723 [Stereocaulon virgatum]|uniref:Myb-like domain-containing protein n=1 Tax=Stereocaulon virgatum TaxID=373712 RepID=A0ABR3ZTQ0_9LECA